MKKMNINVECSTIPLVGYAAQIITEAIAEDGFLDFDDMSHRCSWSPSDIAREVNEAFSQSIEHFKLIYKACGAVRHNGTIALTTNDFYLHLAKSLHSECIESCRKELYEWE